MKNPLPYLAQELTVAFPKELEEIGITDDDLDVISNTGQEEKLRGLINKICFTLEKKEIELYTVIDQANDIPLHRTRKPRTKYISFYRPLL